MFAVPGWNLSAPLKTQTEDPAAKNNGPEGKKSKKRKREQKKEDDVTGENVGDVWDKVVEGREEGRVDAAQAGVETDTAAATGSDETRGKKRKRGKRNNKDKDKVAGAENSAEVQAAVEKDTVAANADTPQIQASAEPISKREQKKQKKDHKANADANSTQGAQKSDPKPTEPLPVSIKPAAPLVPEPKKLTPLQRSMHAKLTSARFRWLNESLYTKPSAEALSLFKESPEFFEEYHKGFAQQVEVWPENPVDGYVQAVLSRGKVRIRDGWRDKKRMDKKAKKGGPAPQEQQEELANSGIKALPRNMKGHCTIADLGCGTASLSLNLQPHLSKLNLTVRSFDLSKPSGPAHDLVTVADISSIPMADGSVDIAVFCLALMGTNWLDFIDEAYRILRWKGELWVAEIKSRFGRVTKSKAGKPPINSIGSLRKDQMPRKKEGKKKGGKKEEDIKEGPQNSDDEDMLATVVDGNESRNPNETDVSAFVEVLRKRGFVLDGEERTSVDLGNKMFVRMQFVKAAAPTKGKNVRKEAEGGGRPMGAGKGKRFLHAKADEEEDEGDEVDGKVLKPCYYKVR
ncbi:hypothetical protein GQ43DRAFT_393325 [Delitschia confertaspora ATCC 74209]|uniref:Ribosomal RNA-processing protein 8 n=1 Tax=Delitschia confertaspora ATCC 74209 TaxID=1513339 RepID=A0A9P4JSP7_9PLEO|nr:hypothetical protein GQ43DRAFT_393325 [Delitschia confertaspora ATCC 74209]